MCLRLVRLMAECPAAVWIVSRSQSFQRRAPSDTFFFIASFPTCLQNLDTLKVVLERLLSFFDCFVVALQLSIPAGSSFPVVESLVQAGIHRFVVSMRAHRIGDNDSLETLDNIALGTYNWERARKYVLGEGSYLPWFVCEARNTAAVGRKQHAGIKCATMKRGKEMDMCSRVSYIILRENILSR